MYSHDEIYVVDSSITKNIRDFLSSYTSESNIVYAVPQKVFMMRKIIAFQMLSMNGSVLLIREISCWNLQELLFREL